MWLAKHYSVDKPVILDTIVEILSQFCRNSVAFPASLATASQASVSIFLAANYGSAAATAVAGLGAECRFACDTESVVPSLPTNSYSDQ